MDTNGWIAKFVGIGLAAGAGYLAKKGIDVSDSTLAVIGAGVVGIIGVIISVFAHNKALAATPPKV